MSLTSLGGLQQQQQQQQLSATISHVNRRSFSPPKSAPFMSKTAFTNSNTANNHLDSIILHTNLQKSKKTKKLDIIAKDKEGGWLVSATPALIPEYDADKDKLCPRTLVLYISTRF